MKLDRKTLNLVVPIEREGGLIYVHAAPIGTPVFERYYKPIAKAYAQMFTGGYGAYAAPRVAKLLLADAAKDLGMWDGPEGVESGLLPEIRRLANLVQPGPTGWMTLPFEEAKASKTIDEDEAAEVENILVFFICVSAMVLKSDLKTMIGITSAIWKTEDTYLNSTEYARSLPTSTATDNSGAKAPQSPIPY